MADRHKVEPYFRERSVSCTGRVEDISALVSEVQVFVISSCAKTLVVGTRSATTVGFGTCSVVAAGRPSSGERRSAQGSATEVVRLERGRHVGSL